MAEQHHSMNRRGLIGATVAACLTGGAAVAETDPDAELIVLEAEYRRVIDWMDGEHDVPLSSEECDRLAHHLQVIENKALAIPPRTIVGLTALLRLVWRSVANSEREFVSGPDDDANFATTIVWTILKNAERLAA